MRTTACIAPALLALALACSVRADATGRNVPADAMCHVPADASWTDAEKFVWRKVCVGEAADFNSEPGFGGVRDPAQPLTWTKDRVLRPSFLEQILLEDRFRNALTRRGVRILGARFSETVDLENVDLKHELWLADCLLESGANFQRLKSSGMLMLDGTAVSGDFNMYGIKIAGDLLLREGGQYDRILLRDARVDGQFSGVRSRFVRAFDADTMQVGNSVFLDGASFPAGAFMVFGRYGGNLSFVGATLHGAVNLAGTSIGGELRLNSSRWSADSSLALRDVKTDTVKLSAELNDYPPGVDLVGFVYRNLEIVAAVEGGLPRKAGIEWARKWLRKQVGYSPQPYEQLASVLHNAGDIGGGAEIRYESRIREKEASKYLAWLWLLILDWTIGYGYHIERALLWVVGFVLLGWGVLFAAKQQDRHGMHIGFTYSLDLLLPLVKLRDRHYKIELDPWPRRYFYLHKIAGYVLAAFLGAGLSGLTK